MASSLLLKFAPRSLTNISCNGVGNRCCMDNLWEQKEKKMENVKLGSKKMSSGSVRVYVREQVSPFINVETKEVALNGNISKKMRENERVSSDGLGILKFVQGKVFLITGATGFLAKVLIEKILRTTPDVSKIYLLIKAKDKEAAMKRLKSEIINTELFKRLRQIHGSSHLNFILSKLVPVVGNICDSNLGMELGLADQIADEVNFIINSAGNTTLDERFDVSLATNTLGPCRVLSYARRCNKLMLLLHVSTAYVNGERQGVVMEKPFYMGDSIAKEKAYSESPKRSFPLLDVEAEIMRALDVREDFKNIAASQKMKEMGFERAKSYGWQDTYVFTKAMGEMMIESEREEVPVVIIRPSVIESTYREPIPGWIEGIRMLDPMIVYYAKGELTGFPVNPNGVMDVVPADMVVNAILAATVKHGTVNKPGLSIYHVASSVVNPLVLQDMFGYFFQFFNSSPYMDLKRRPINVERMKLFSSMDEFYSHIETEAIRRSTGAAERKAVSRKLSKSSDIAKHLAEIYEPYMFYGGRFDSSNTQNLFKEMSQEEKKSFGFDVSSIDWKNYICNIHIPGLMTHALKGRGV